MLFRSKGQNVSPKPFVMHNEGVIVDREGNPIPTNQAYKTTEKNGEYIYRFVDSKNPHSINDLADAMSDEIERTGEVKLFKDFNCVMLPYSVISQSRSVSRKRFLTNISPNTILIFGFIFFSQDLNIVSYLGSLYSKKLLRCKYPNEFFSLL